MLERVLTTKRCSAIISLVINKRGWTRQRIARVIGSSVEYVHRVEKSEQSFQVSDVEALAKACKQRPAMLIFDSLETENLSPKTQSLHDLTVREIRSHEEFQRAMKRKPAKKRRSPTRAA